MIIINSWSVWHLPAFRQEKKRRLKITEDYKRLRTKITKKKKKEKKKVDSHRTSGIFFQEGFLWPPK